MASKRWLHASTAQWAVDRRFAGGDSRFLRIRPPAAGRLAPDLLRVRSTKHQSSVPSLSRLKTRDAPQSVDVTQRS
jgi:hypothetical protein